MKIEQTTEYDSMTETSNYATHSPITTITYPQTTDSLQSTTKRTKVDTICNDQVAGNIIGINVANHDDNVESDQTYPGKLMLLLTMMNIHKKQQPTTDSLQLNTI